MEKKLIKERNEKIIELSEKYSQKELGKIFGTTQSNIGRILKKNGIKRKKSRLNMSRLALNVDFFKEIDTPKKAYWLGYICADGCIQKGNGKLAICCKDVELLEKFKKDIESEHKISERHVFDKRTNKWYNEYSLQIGNELFVKNIIDHGITHEKTDICNFPNIKEEFYSYFVAGLFDGDGSVCYVTKKKSLRCNLISTKEILDFIDAYLLKMYGIMPCKKQKISQNKTNVYKQYWYKNSLLFLNFIYQGDENIFLKRKYKIYEFHKRK